MAAVKIINEPLVVECEENLRNHDSLWISPEGVAYPVRDCGHSEWCQIHTEDEGGLYVNVSQLERLGWIHLSFRTAYCYENKLTGKAFDTLLAWCKIWARSFSDTVNDLGERF